MLCVCAILMEKYTNINGNLAKALETYNFLSAHRCSVGDIDVSIDGGQMMGAGVRLG